MSSILTRADAQDPGLARGSLGDGRALLRLIRSNRQIYLGVGFLVLFSLVALFAPLLAPFSPTSQLGVIYQAPSLHHWLGLDNGGFDVLSNLIYGARTSLLVGAISAVAGILIGGVIGLVAGYFGGVTDVVLMRVTDYFLVIPDIPLMMVFGALFGRSVRNIIIIIALIYWTSVARLIRAQVKSIKQRGYVRRAHMLGASHGRILATHVLPQAMPLLIANAVLLVANAIFAETYISFVGLGDPSTISWGKMIDSSLSGGAIFYNAWWAILPPGLAVTAVVLAATVVGQGLEDALNPRLKVSHLATKRFRLRPLGGNLEKE